MRLRRGLWILLPLGLALLGGLFWLGQSQWLGRAVEGGLSTLLRTPVEVEGVRLDLFRLRGEVKRLRIASRRDPRRWAFDGGPAVFQLQFWPLLEGKLVVERLELTGIDGGTPRRLPRASASPPPQPATAEDGPSLGERLRAALPRLDLGLLAQRLELDALLDDQPLATVAWAEHQIETWQTQLQVGREAVAGLDGLPGEFDTLRRRIEALDLDTRDPRRLREQLQELKEIRQRLRVLRDRLRQERSVLDEALTFPRDQAGWREARAQDLALLDRIGGLDLKRLADALFGAPVVERVGAVLAVLQGARGLLAGSDDDPPPPPPRRAGRTFTFPVEPPLPPALLLMDGRLEGRWPGHGPFDLRLAQLSSAPAQWHRPVDFQLHLGERPAWRLTGTLDHRRDRDQDRIAVQAAPLALAGIPLDTPAGQPLPTALSLEEGRLEGELAQEAGRLQGHLQLRADRVRFHFPEQAAVEAAYRPYYPELRRLFLQQHSALRLDIRLAGTLEAPELRLSSSLDQDLSQGLQRLLGQKLEQARARLRQRLEARVEDRLSQARERLLAEAEPLRARLSKLEARLKELGRLREEKRRAVEEALAEAGKRLERKAKEKAKEKAEELRRGLGL